MAANLQIGRVGLDTDLEHPFQIVRQAGGNGLSMTIRGHIKETGTLAEALAIRDQLVAQVRSESNPGLVAVVCAVDSTVDGFYVLESANVDASSRNASLISTGFFPYSVNLQAVDTPVFTSGLTGGVLPNDHSVSSGNPFVAPPVGATSFSPDLSLLSRSGEDGTVETYLAVDESDVPVFSVSPGNYLAGACSIYIGSPSYMVAGADSMKDDPANWTISNTLVRVVAGTSGRFTTGMHDGTSWESSMEWRLEEGGAAIGAWDHIVPLRYTPEYAGVRLIQNRAGTSQGRRTLDISVRRGSRFVNFFYTTTSSATLKVRRQTTDAATAVSPWGVRDSSNDAGGNRWVLGTLSTKTNDLTNGGISKTAAVDFDFFIGYEAGGSGAQAGDQATNLGDQYIHHLSERVVPMVRSGVGL